MPTKNRPFLRMLHSRRPFVRRTAPRRCTLPAAAAAPDGAPRHGRWPAPAVPTASPFVDGGVLVARRAPLLTLLADAALEYRSTAKVSCPHPSPPPPQQSAACRTAPFRRSSIPGIQTAYSRAPRQSPVQLDPPLLVPPLPLPPHPSASSAARLADRRAARGRGRGGRGPTRGASAARGSGARTASGAAAPSAAGLPGERDGRHPGRRPGSARPDPGQSIFWGIICHMR